MKLILILISISLFLLLGCNNKYTESELKVVLTEVQSNNYQVFVSFRVENNTPNPTDIYLYNNTMIYVLGYYLNFDIYHNDQKLELTYGRERVKFPFKNDFITLNPGDVYSEKIDLTRYYNLIGSNESAPWPKGAYTIICSYSYKYSGTKYGQNLWEGSAKSDTLKIVVE